ncbi:MAG: multiheme c-type cytochrome [Gemmataceae bacterium]
MPAVDNPDYLLAAPDPDPAKPVACGSELCKTIHAEWAGSPHGRATKNPRLLSLMTGKDARGKEHAKWNLSREHPLGLGVCSRCHAPTYRSPDLSYDLEKAEGVAASGVHCDLCHKVANVPTEKLGLRFGIDALDLLRPEDGDQLFYGPLEDAVRPGESFGHFPIYKESRYCAACHEGTVFGVKVYTTYSEWKESPAAKRGQQCQSCHMAPTGTMTNIAPGKGGIERDRKTLASHAMIGASEEMLKKSVQLITRVEQKGKSVQVTMELTARNVGHRVPSGCIDRHLLLLVEAWDAAGRAVFGAGPRLPAALAAPYEKKAAWLFGRRLIDDAGASPLPFWLPHEREEDTRLAPETTERRVTAFPGAAVRVRIQLLYRPFWPAVLESRGWMERQVAISIREYVRGGGVWLERR